MGDVAEVIAVANQKGGVGKSTTTYNLASLLANREKRVLAIDSDPQGNLTLEFGFDHRALDEASLTLTAALLDTEVLLETLIRANDPFLIPGSRSLRAVRLDDTTVLKRKLKSLLSRFDYILIDCAPTLTDTTAAALVAANSVLIPTDFDKKSFDGLGELLDTIFAIRDRSNPDLSLLGILPTQFNRGFRYDRRMLKQLKDWAGDNLKVFEPVPRTTTVKEASEAGQPLFVYAPKSAATQRYTQVADYIIDYVK